MIKDVIPLFICLFIKVETAIMDFLSQPDVGSSYKNILAFFIMPQAIVSLCFSPLDRAKGCFLIYFSSSKSFNIEIALSLLSSFSHLGKPSNISSSTLSENNW